MTPDKNPHAVALGKLGGKAGTGAAKARYLSRVRAQAMVKVRWDKAKAAAEAKQREV